MHRALLASLFALACLAGPAQAQDLVDQECLPEFWGWYSIAGGTPIGQEFVPTFGSLTFVELWVFNDTSSLNDTARVFVVIHADSIQGAELGASKDVHIPKPFDDAVRFDFPDVIPLEPGRTYVIEARRSQGPGNPMLAMGDQLGACPGVRGWFNGVGFSNGGDFWYRTGIDPSPAVRATWGGLKQRYR